MKLYESEAKSILEENKIPVPRCYGLVSSTEEARKTSVNFPFIAKAMVLTGGRGKAGGIKKISNPLELDNCIQELFNLKIKGLPVKKLLLEEIVYEIGACYLGITIDPDSFNILIAASAEGGVDIEETAKNKPKAIFKLLIPDNPSEISPNDALKVADSVSSHFPDQHQLKKQMAGIIAKLYSIFQSCDCRLAEINPVIISPSGPIAADAKIVIDDNGVFRQTELLEKLGINEIRHDVSELSSHEIRASKSGFKYVDLLPLEKPKDKNLLYVGLVPGGAGYGIFSIDEVVNIGKKFFQDRVVPVNFMDSGGGPTKAQVAEMFDLLLDHPLVDCIITSRFGGISSCDVFIRGLIECLRSRQTRRARMVPIFGRMVGTDLANARIFLEKANVETPEPLKHLRIEVGNTKIMADVIRDGISMMFEIKEKAL